MTLDFGDSPLNALIAIDLEIASSAVPLAQRGSRADHLNRLVNFMFYELASKTNGQTPDDIFLTLNEYFFRFKNFRIDASPVLLDEILKKRCGCYSAVALLYIYLSRRLGLKVDFVRWPQRAILKWQCKGKSRYLDLEQCGQVLTEDELLAVLNERLESPKLNRDQVESLTHHEAVIQYLTYLSFFYRRTGDREKLHTTFCLILSLEPENARFLAERALLRRELGLVKDALHDMKRYFAFTEKVSASSDLVLAYEELKTLVTSPV